MNEYKLLLATSLSGTVIWSVSLKTALHELKTFGMFVYLNLLSAQIFEKKKKKQK